MKNSLVVYFLYVFTATVVLAVGFFAQNPPAEVSQNTQAKPIASLPHGDPAWWYLPLFILGLGLIGAIGYGYVKKKAANREELGGKDDALAGRDTKSIDAEAESEWAGGKNASEKEAEDMEVKAFPNGPPNTNNVLRKKTFDETGDEEKRKLKTRQFSKLPITSIFALEPVEMNEELPISNDESLLSAIEQVQYGYEGDVQLREIALRVLAKFRTKNSVEAISQLALYDLSIPLRSKALSVLAAFDHESVFETILLACADPTREVRDAAARSLFHLSFDRAEAWTRIAECGDEFRIVQTARAAIESDLVAKSIDRLVHEDRKYAYEAFALVALLIRAGETKEIFEIIQRNSDHQVKLAILHVLKVIKDERTIPELYTYVEKESLPEDLISAANEAIRSINKVAV